MRLVAGGYGSATCSMRGHVPKPTIGRIRSQLTLAVVAGALACSDSRVALGPGDPDRVAPGSVRPTVGGFACEVTYTVITQTSDAELAEYGVEPLTDTASVCQTWTGSDYKVEVTQIGSSEPVSDFSEDIVTAVYQNGATTAYDTYGSYAESQPDVGPTGFEFVAATEEEKQASYSDPYYGVMASSDPACAVPPCALQNSGPVDATVAGVGSQNLRRPALRALLKGKDEIRRSLEGYRQFRQILPTGDQVTISLDPDTELIRRQEIRNVRGRIVAELNWSRVREKYVRDRMDVVSEEMINGRPVVSRTTILLKDVRWGQTLGR